MTVVINLFKRQSCRKYLIGLICGMEAHSPLVYRREALKYEDFRRFKISFKCLQQQYSSTYNERLKVLKNHLLGRARTKWEGHEVITISQLSERNHANTCIVIGTLYKYQELKQSVLHELGKELQLDVQPAKANYASFKDVLYLEDETLRIKLVHKHMNIEDIVTGIVCAVLGHELENGAFSVLDWCFAGCYPKLFDEPSLQNGKILLISGLDINNCKQLLSLDLLSEWIGGMIGCNETQQEVASLVCIIIAGNSVRGSIETYNHKEYFKTNPHQTHIFKDAAMVTYRFDKFLHQIVQSCPVILMPGEYDPTCHTLPQNSIHPCIFPLTSRCKSFYGVTNPWVGKINSRIVAGSSGQPIMDIMKVSGLSDVSPLTWLERTLLWGHYAPTLPAFPSSETDPFIIKECPNIYFVGNMDKEAIKIIQNMLMTDEGQLIRLICIPKFSETPVGVIVNLQDLNTWPISFDID